MRLLKGSTCPWCPLLPGIINCAVHVLAVIAIMEAGHMTVT